MSFINRPAKLRLLRVATLFVGLLGGAMLLFTLSSSRNAVATKQLSQIFDVTQPYSVIGILPDSSAFLNKLRGGKNMRAFFDSPLGLHFVRSAPLRGAAHLHRLISLAPSAWQWNLYTLITDGPVYYRSHGKAFTLIVTLNKKGIVLTSLLKEAHAARTGDLLVIASDASTLSSQLAYLKNPKLQDSFLDSTLGHTDSLTMAWGSATQPSKNRSLFRSLMTESLGLNTISGCFVEFTPSEENISANGECNQNEQKDTSTAQQEEIRTPDYPAIVYFKKPSNSLVHMVALNGLQSEFGYLIPQLFFSGPTVDQKSIEFLSQAFKTRRHVIESKNGAIQVRYPYPYAYADKKFELFAPHLSANNKRFFWNSFLPQVNTKAITVSPNLEHNFHAKIQIYALLKNSEAAIKQFDAIYSPGHFNEFRDALFKSLPTLQTSSLNFYAVSKNKKLRLAGTFAFIDA
jgi:hypothetical protein